jgi:hypothetical protein
MGSWGTAVFSDDTACDIRAEYRELLEDQVPDDEATRRVVAAYAALADDEEHLLWIALAAVQSRLGRLDDHVRDRALAVIDEGRGLELWEEAGAALLAKRTKVLADLRRQLTGPQPARKVVRRPYRHVTDLEPGTVLFCPLEAGDLALIVVRTLHVHRINVAPVVSPLRWRGPHVPDDHTVGELEMLTTHLHALGDTQLLQVARYRKKDIDWTDVGLERVGTRPDLRADVSASAHTMWRHLPMLLEQRLTRAGLPPKG